MRLIFLLLILVAGISTCQGQFSKGNILISPGIGQLHIDVFNPRNYGGIEFEKCLGEHVGIHYSVLFGADYFHMPVGILVGAVGGVLGLVSGAGFIFFLTAAVPEGVSFYIPLGDKTTLSPYISPLQLEFVRKRIVDEDTFVGGAVGVKLHQSLNADWLFSPFVEYKIHYVEAVHPGISAGLKISRVIKM
jgi:hypothetical protein